MATGSADQNAVTILWRIENISSFEKGFHSNGVYSPRFQSNNLGGSTVFLCLSFKNEDDMHLGLYGSAPFFNCKRDCEFSFLTWDGSPLISRTVRNQSGSYIDMPDCPTSKEVFVIKKSSFLCGDALTVRCRVWKSLGRFSQSEFISVRSRIDVLQDSFLWPVAGFSEFKDLRSVTPILTGLPHGSQVLKCDCSFAGPCMPDSFLEIEITADKVVEAFLLKLEVSVLDHKKKEIELLKTRHTFLESPTKYKWSVPQDELNDKLQNVLLHFSCEDSLSFVFHFEAVLQTPSKFSEVPYRAKKSYLSNTRTIPTVTEMGCQASQQDDSISDRLKPEFNSLRILAEDLRTMYCENTMSDYTLRAGEVSFPVHKNILSVRSPVFRSMFSSDMKESCSSSSDIPDLDSHTLNRMLTFLYASSVEPDLDFKGSAKLYYAADKYQVDNLKSRCSSILRSGTTVSNVSDVLTLAHKHEDQELTSFAHEFILKRYDEVMHSDAWEAFLDADPCLAGKTTHQLYKEKKARKKLTKATK